MKSLSLAQPHLLVVVGIPGSGKTAFSEKFAETFSAPLIRLESLYAYVKDSSSAEAIAFSQLDELLKTKQTILVDGIGSSRTDRVELTRRGRARGYATLFIWVQTDPATAKDRLTRVAKGKSSPALSSADYDKLMRRFTTLSPTEKMIVISGKHTFASQAKVVLKKLAMPRAEISTHKIPPAREVPATDRRRSITIR